jgi:superfamily II DNA/RNA helicase
VKVEVSRPASTVATTLQQLVKTGREPHDKRDTLRRLIRSADPFKNAIIFCNRKREVAQLHRSLVRHGFNAAALHGDLDQAARTAALESFRKGEAKLLIASDVAARGLDIPDVSHIFNFDVPHHPDDYVHRIGRTGRAGKTGTAITIVAPSDGKAIAAIEKLIGQPIAWAGEPPPAQETQEERPERNRRRGGPRNQRRSDHNNGHAPSRHEHGEPREPTPAPVTHLDEARQQRQAPPHHREVAEPSTGGGDHLPAFLLRPVVRKKA